MSFATESRERSRPVLPLAAMVDVLFLLLIFFMTASLYREAEAQMAVDLPQAESPRPVQRVDQVIVNITADNRVYLQGLEVAPPDLPARFQALHEDAGIRALVVRGDTKSEYGLAVFVMDLAQRAGIEDVSLATIKPASEIE